MEKRTEGAWIIHHAKKLQDVVRTSEFEDIELAGKCGLFLSSLAASDEESCVTKEKANVIADALNINKKLELPIIIKTLSDEKLIDVSTSGDILVLGITTSNVLIHTSTIFKDSTSDNFQLASLELTDYCSEKPIKDANIQEYISDTYKLDTTTTLKLFQQSEDIGFIDYEKIDSSKTYFNGNLFKTIVRES